MLASTPAGPQLVWKSVRPALPSLCRVGDFIVMMKYKFICSTSFSVPQPGVDVTLSHTAPLYAGTGLTLTCTVDANDGNGEKVKIRWSGLQDIPEERYSVTGTSGSSNTYTDSLTISPLADQDDGTYTCTVIVTGGSNVLQATASDDVSITVMGECTLCFLYMCIHSHSSLHSSPSSSGVHISCQWIPHCRPDLLPHLLCAGSSTSGSGAQH